jgi:hypothetical protein
MKNTRRKRVSDEVDTAYHEVGHAVACVHYRVLIEHVSIEPVTERQGVMLGHVAYHHQLWRRKNVRNCQREFYLGMAGAMGGALIRTPDGMDPGATADYVAALTALVEVFKGDAERIGAASKAWSMETADLILGYAPAVHALAAALLASYSASHVLIDSLGTRSPSSAFGARPCHANHRHPAWYITPDSPKHPALGRMDRQGQHIAAPAGCFREGFHALTAARGSAAPSPCIPGQP